jgi:hypothetical protein
MKVPFSFLKHYHVSGKDYKQRESQKALLFPPDPNPSGLARASSERNWLLRASGGRDVSITSKAGEGRTSNQDAAITTKQDAAITSKQENKGCDHHDQAGRGHR